MTNKAVMAKQYSRLTVLCEAERIRGQVAYSCRCTCGTVKAVLGANLRTGVTKSCGCLAREMTAKRQKSHGMFGTPEYAAWAGMKSRCLAPTNEAYADYGGRGLRVSRRWLKFENFFADMGLKPSPELQLERKNNDKGYSKSNCEWSTRERQIRNRRNTLWLTLGGKKITLADAADQAGIARTTAQARLKYGWDHERIINTPVRKRTTKL